MRSLPVRPVDAGVWIVPILLLLVACDPVGWDGRAAICLVDPSMPIELRCSTEPRRIVDDIGFVAIAAGHDHTCALTADGRPYCWGRNVYVPIDLTTGQGIATRPVAIPTDLRFVDIAAGDDHTCAITAEGEGYCWGANHSGQLGTGPVGGEWLSHSDTPARVAGDITFAMIRAGRVHTCGIDTEGAAYCWGMDFYGEVGRGFWEIESQPTPFRVVGDHVFASIGGGQRFTCALDPAGQAWCWGHGHIGELGTLDVAICGDFFMDVRCSPWPVPVATQQRFSALASGAVHSCGITAGGTAHCWGDYGQGQLGPGPGGRYGLREVPAHRFTVIHAGGSTTCGTTAAGETLCWGGNWMGQLGTGSDEYTDSNPTVIAGGHRFAVLSIGLAHACGITDAGATYCWGSNERGQLGTGVW
jgi:alpha-tubulin suppressor-like RCC1 family protein